VVARGAAGCVAEKVRGGAAVAARMEEDGGAVTVRRDAVVLQFPAS